MSSYKLPSAALLCAALLLSSGCDSPAEPDPEYPTSSLSFTYSGSRSGTFSVVGEVPAALDAAGTRQWTTGDRHVERGREYVYVLANLPAGTAGRHGIQLLIPADGPGTYSLANGGLSGVVFDYDTPQDPYSFTDGSVKVTLLRTNRIVGTFSGSLMGNNGRMLQITGGQFDVCVAYADTQPGCQK